MSGQDVDDLEPVTLEIDDVTLKFRGQWVDPATDEPIERGGETQPPDLIIEAYGTVAPPFDPPEQSDEDATDKEPQP